MIWLLDDVDRLYEGVVMDPDSWIEQRFVDWSESVVSGGEIDREISRRLRRVMATARKLRAFWSDGTDRPDLEWRSKVDIALGPRAWRPVMNLAMILLDSHPDEELFEHTAGLFRIVNNAPYLDGIGYEKWSERHTPSL
ncbi:MAG: hypothetical protein M3094_00695 [Actinomycetia bacterium]|nr:hypothetical protein [Actinomycetes bacterium]